MSRIPRWINSKTSDDGGGTASRSPWPTLPFSMRMPPTKNSYIPVLAREEFLSGKGSVIEKGSVYYTCKLTGYPVLSEEDMVIERLSRFIDIWDD